MVHEIRMRNFCPRFPCRGFRRGCWLEALNLTAVGLLLAVRALDYRGHLGQQSRVYCLDPESDEDLRGSEPRCGFGAR